MEELLTGATPNYRVKNIEAIMKGSDVRARIFTPAHGDTIPWHFHQSSADRYFVLEGALTIVHALRKKHGR
jgi:mannose-6-phosphate isomerase-like protein (cupin superfamily)